MTHLVFHHDHLELPPAGDDLLPVQIYGLSGKKRGDISRIGNPIVKNIKKLGVKLPPEVMDFLTIAVAVTAADTFVHRENSEDGWTRQLALRIPLNEPERWSMLQRKLEQALHFLSGDMWSFEFTEGGFPSPEPILKKRRKIKLKGLNCVSLLSGGLDSAIGAIDLLEQKQQPLFVSHGYSFDKGKQDLVASMLDGRFSRLSLNADPHISEGNHEITMRTRSLSFFAFAAVGASALKSVNQLQEVPLLVPENGFISINAPLTPRRVGTLSTRTTHPHFLSSIQEILDEVGVPGRISNPYQFKTKGQMVQECRNKVLLDKVTNSTVSCSHWKRFNQQCGVCVPCIIRRAALHAGGLRESTSYKSKSLSHTLRDPDHRDDLMALITAIKKKASCKPGHWILDSGPLPADTFNQFKELFSDGLEELEVFLSSEGV